MDPQDSGSDGSIQDEESSSPPLSPDAADKVRKLADKVAGAGTSVPPLKVPLRIGGGPMGPGRSPQACDGPGAARPGSDYDSEEDAAPRGRGGGGAAAPGRGGASPAQGQQGHLRQPGRVGGSAPVLRNASSAFVEDPRSERSEERQRQASGTSREEGHSGQEEPQDQDSGYGYASYSWRETLARFPSLLRLYPLAASNEAAAPSEEEERDEDDEGEDGPKPPSSPSGPAILGQLEGNEVQDYLNGPPEKRPVLPHTPKSGASPLRDSPLRGQAAQQQAAAQQRAHTVTPSPRTPHEATPHSTAQAAQHSRPRQAWSREADLAAWAEVDQAREQLERWEVDVARREAAVRRSEARNRAAALQLTELRRRLDDYGEELEEGVLALTAQQEQLREERRQTAELQARARKMCAAAVRDDIVNTKIGNWDRRSWTPASAMGV